MEKMTALVVDDSPDIRRVMKWRLERRGFTNIEVAESGQAGIDLARQKSPHLIMLDMILPGKNGLEVLTEIRTFLPHAVILVATSVTERDTVLQFKEQKADFYVLKTAPKEKIDEVLGKAIDLLHARFPANVQ